MKNESRQIFSVLVNCVSVQLYKTKHISISVALLVATLRLLCGPVVTQNSQTIILDVPLMFSMHKMLTNGRGYMCRLWDIDHHVKTAEKRLYFRFRQSNRSECTNSTMYTAFSSLQVKIKNTEPSNAELTDRKTLFMPENRPLSLSTMFSYYIKCFFSLKRR